MKKILLFYLLGICYNSFSQIITKSYELSSKLNETSGLEIYEDYFVTHNDSGNDPALFFIDKEGKIIKTRFITKYSNHDWEDITKDNNYFYIADTGNNFDNRKNLNIIKIPLDSNSQEQVQKISFSYPEQKEFKYNLKSEFDAEALITIGESLILFTKNRATKSTQIYKLPKSPGIYEAEKIAELNTKAIITGADYHQETQTLALTATIDFSSYYILTINKFSLDMDVNFNINKYEIPIQKCQVEAIKIISPKNFWLTSEDEMNNKSAILFKVEII